MRPRGEDGGPSRRGQPRRQSLGALLAFVVTLAPLAVTILLSLTNRFEADDFSTKARFSLYSFWGAWWNQLHVLNGRFAGYLFTDVMTLVGPRHAWLPTWCVLAAIVGALFLVVPPQPRGVVHRWLITVALAASVVLVSPAPEQVFLWIAGLGMAGASIALAVGAVGVSRLASASAGRARLGLCGLAGLLGLLASGSYETTAIVLIVGSASAVVAVGWSRRAAIVAISSVLFGALCGLAIVALVPGSSARKGALVNGAGPREAVAFGLRHVVPFLEGAAGDGALWIALAAGLLASSPVLPWARRIRWAVASVTGTVVALAASFSLASWTLGEMPPGRTLTIPGIALVGACFLLGWLVPLPPRASPVIASGVALLAAIGALYLAELRPARRSWAQGWDVRDAQLRAAAGREVVEVELLTNPDGLEDFGPDPTFWVNEAAARYYEVGSIVARSDAAGP